MRLVRASLPFLRKPKDARVLVNGPMTANNYERNDMRALISGILVVLVVSPAGAKWENAAAEWQDASPAERQWFKDVKAPNNVPCCDVADGHRTTFEWRQDDDGGHFWVPIKGKMFMVPKGAVIWNTGNPTDTSIVWYSELYSRPDGAPYIRCFVPIGGV